MGEAGFAGACGPRQAPGDERERGCGAWATSCIVPQTAAINKLWIVRRKKPPCFRVFSTLIQMEAGSKKIARNNSRSEDRPRQDSIAPGGIILFLVTKAADTNV